MRHEHKSHVLVISLMLMFILVVFGWVLFNHPLGASTTSGITTSLPYAPVVVDVNEDIPAKSAIQTEISVLIGLSIILAFLFAVYLVMRIVREFKHLR